jgi:hypothetical protein
MKVKKVCQTDFAACCGIEKDSIGLLTKLNVPAHLLHSIML